MSLIKRLGSLIKSVFVFVIKKELAAFKYIVQVGIYTSVAAFLMIGTCYLVDILMNWLHPLPPMPQSSPFMGFDAITLFSVCLSIGLVEEGMFRYLIYDCMLRKWLTFPIWLAAFLSALLFGAAHFNNAILSEISLWYVLPQVIGAAILGFFFIYLYNKIGLHMAIFVHALYDYLVLSTLNMPKLEPLVLAAVICGGSIVSLWLVYKAWRKIYG